MGTSVSRVDSRVLSRSSAHQLSQLQERLLARRRAAAASAEKRVERSAGAATAFLRRRAPVGELEPKASLSPLAPVIASSTRTSALGVRSSSRPGGKTKARSVADPERGRSFSAAMPIGGGSPF